MRILANMANTLAAELLVSANPGKEAVLPGLIPLKVMRLLRYCRDIQSIIFTYYHCVLIQNFQTIAKNVTVEGNTKAVIFVGYSS